MTNFQCAEMIIAKMGGMTDNRCKICRKPTTLLESEKIDDGTTEYRYFCYDCDELLVIELKDVIGVTS